MNYLFDMSSLPIFCGTACSRLYAEPDQSWLFQHSVASSQSLFCSSSGSSSTSSNVHPNEWIDFKSVSLENLLIQFCPP